MADVMKLAMERRSRVTAEIERLKEEVTRLNQFIRMGENLIAGASRPGGSAAMGSATPAMGAPKPETTGSTVSGFPKDRVGA